MCLIHINIVVLHQWWTTVNWGIHLFNKLYYLLIAWVSMEYI